MAATSQAFPVLFEDNPTLELVVGVFVLLVSIRADFRVSLVDTEDGKIEHVTEYRWIEVVLTDGEDPRGCFGHQRAWQHTHLFQAPGSQRREIDKRAEALFARIKESGRLSLAYLQSSEHWTEYKKPCGGQREEDAWIREQQDKAAGLLDWA